MIQPFASRYLCRKNFWFRISMARFKLPLMPSDGDTIIVKPGTYLRIFIKGEKQAGAKPARSDVVASTIIDGQEAGAVIRVDMAKQVVISGFTNRNGTGVLVDGQHYGGGIMFGKGHHKPLIARTHVTRFSIFIDYRNPAMIPTGRRPRLNTRS